MVTIVAAWVKAETGVGPSNTAYRERYASTPYHVMIGQALLTSLSILASSIGEDWKVDALNEEASRREVANAEPSNDCTTWLRKE